MAAALGATMDQIGVALATVPGLRVFDFPPASAQPPFAFVDFPTSLVYDLTFRRGDDRAEFKVYVAVGSQVDRAVRDQLSAYAASSGEGSVFLALINGVVGKSLRVESVEFGPVLVAGVTYAGAVFTVDVVM